MKRLVTTFLIFSLFFCLKVDSVSLNQISDQPLANRFVIYNGTIWSAKNKTLPAQWGILIEGDKISHLADVASLRNQCLQNCTWIDAKGGFIMPGIHDGHAHFLSGGARKFRVQVSGSNTRSIVSTVRDFARANPNHPWIRGRGWDAAGYSSGFPNRSDLDLADSQRPIVLVDSDGHQMWTNSKAIELAKIDRNTPNPPGGIIVRDRQGEATGIFLETAMDLISRVIPPLTEAEIRLYAESAQQIGLQAGVTALQGGPDSLKTLGVLSEMSREQKLKIRTFLWGDLEATDEEFEKYIQFKNNRGSENLVEVVAFKGFVDGVISSYTAALHDPYSDKPELQGNLNFEKEQLLQLVLRANRAGFPVALHAIGDRGVSFALDVFEESKRILNHNLINRIEHIELLRPQDAQRFQSIGVAASMQPSHMHFGSPSSSYYPARVGTARLPHLFAWNEILKTGSHLVFGTDFPVVDWDPMEGIHCAIRRTYYNGTPFFPEQAVDPETALEAFTANPALVIKKETLLGKIATGFLADIVIYPRDPRSGEFSSLFSNPPQLVMMGGQIVYQR